MTDHTDIVERLNKRASYEYATWGDDSTAREASAEITRLRAEAEALRNALQDVREALHLENEKLRGPICDTIWMPHGAETLFDFLDAAIAATKGTT